MLTSPRRSLIGFFLAASTLLLLHACGRIPDAPTQQAARPLRVLFIGNSYTYVNNLPQMLFGLAQSATPPRPLETATVVRGGASLQQLWDDGSAVAAIKRGGWDVVVLQEQSRLGNQAPPVNGVLQIGDPTAFHAYARRFDAEIRRAGAKAVFYLTWARQDAPETQAALNAAYQSIARELNAGLAPVGPAWALALQRHPQLRLHQEDQSHPSITGTYLAACVFYATLYGQSPEALAHESVSLDPAVARELQQIAWQVVQGQPIHHHGDTRSATYHTLR